MFRSAFLLLLLLWGQETVWSVRLVEVRVPGHAREGGSALLDCQYDLEGEDLYSVKWYKDKQEFFRYLPKNNPPSMPFKRPGVNVNMDKSSSTVVALDDLTQESEGEYTCEVSGEAPSFTTVRSSKYIIIYLLPDRGPQVVGLKEQYSLGEFAEVNCTTPASRPVPNLKWLINDKSASMNELQGPLYQPSADRPDAAETTMQLRFRVAPKHFVNSVMTLKCQATIAPLYQRETYSTHYIALPFTLNTDRAPFQENSDVKDPASDSSTKQCQFVSILFTVIQIILLQIV